jgi:hypothetical protein
LGEKKSRSFLGELAPCEHLIQIYEDDGVFLNSLEAFVSAGILANEVTIVIATPSYLDVLSARLLLKGINIDAARGGDLYIPIDANKALAEFMYFGSPDEALFKQFISGLVERAKGRRLRAFGEMVALLWGQGFKSAKVRLEELWNSFCDDGIYCLFCAYPKSGFAKDSKESIDEICKNYSTVIAGWQRSKSEVKCEYTGISSK